MEGPLPVYGVIFFTISSHYRILLNEYTHSLKNMQASTAAGTPLFPCVRGGRGTKQDVSKIIDKEIMTLIFNIVTVSQQWHKLLRNCVFDPWTKEVLQQSAV